MGLPRHPILLSAVLGLSGCILFTDPINEAPVVTVTGPAGTVARGVAVQYTATVKDEDSPSSFTLEWAALAASASGSCSGIRVSDWGSSRMNGQPMRLAIDVAYSFETDSLSTVCICALATDHHGARGIGCSAPITPVPPTPVASIQDISTAPKLSGDHRPLCSQVHLFAPRPLSIPDGDVAKYAWLPLDYNGEDSSGKSILLGPCTGVPSDKADQHRCFTAKTPGKYTVTLTVSDSYVTAAGTGNTISSDQTQFVVVADTDQPACLQRTEPDITAQRVLLSRNLSGAYQSRVFSVASVTDDCQPFPSQQPPAFYWSIYDSTSPSPSWAYQQVGQDPSRFELSQSRFPNARPGDTIKLRVEVRDTPVQTLYANPQYQIPSCTTELDMCCQGGACGASPCVRWTTWTVQFEP